MPQIFNNKRLEVRMQGIIRSFAEDITQHRKHAYSHQLLQEYLLAHSQVGCCTLRILNSQTLPLQTMMLKQKHNKNCIVYAHGLGSNKLEALPVAKMLLREGYDVCSFDFSGSGRSEGDYTSYGLHQKDDLNSILAYLETNHIYQHYVLWGRSMGAVAIILSQAANKYAKVNALVLDSPFSSFEKVAVEIAAKKSLIPQFMLNLLIEPLKTYFATNHPVNPFSTDIPLSLSRITNCPAMFIYSPNDTIVDASHTLELIKHCHRPPLSLSISEDHNKQRSKDTLRRAIAFIEQSRENLHRRDASRNRCRGISVASKEGRDRDNVSVSVSVRSQSKIKLVSSLSNRKMGGRERSTRTVGTLGELDCGLVRSSTEESPLKPKRMIGIASMCLEGRLSNKQNLKPSLNRMRRNRFR